jgi:hypothetical protein
VASGQVANVAMQRTAAWSRIAVAGFAPLPRVPAANINGRFGEAASQHNTWPDRQLRAGSTRGSQAGANDRPDGSTRREEPPAVAQVESG